MKKKIILSIFLLILILTGLGVYCINGDKISKNVYVQNINIGDLTKIYNKIKDNTSMPAFNEFNSQDYQEWKNLKTNLAAIDWTEVIF